MPAALDAGAACPLRAAPPDPRGRRGGAAAAARVARAPDRRRRARLARVALPRGCGRRDARDHRPGRRRRLQPPATDRPLHRAARRAEGRLREADDRGAEPGRDGRAVPGAPRLGERRADPRARLGRDRRRHRQLPDPLPRQRRVRLARHPRRARLDLPLRGPGHGLPSRQRAVLPLPLPLAAAARARAELRGGRRARRPARASSARSRRARRSSSCSASATRSPAGCCSSTRSTRPSTRSRSAATPSALSAATTRRSPSTSTTSSSAGHAWSPRVTVVRIPPTLRGRGRRRASGRGDRRDACARCSTTSSSGIRRSAPQILADGGIAPFVNVYLGGEDVRTLDGLDTAVPDGETVILLPAMAGGARARGRRPWPRACSTSSGRRRSSSCRASSPKPSVTIYAKLEGQNPTGSIKDRVAKAMIEAAEASGELEPGRALLEPTSGNTGISLALVASLKGYPLTCVMPENATEERKRLLRLYGADIVLSPAAEGSNGAVRLALEMAESDPRWFVPFQYANAANPRAHYEGTGAEIAAALDRVDVLVAGLGHGRHADGRRRAPARDVPRRHRRGGRAAPRRSRDGAPLARRRLRAADPRRLEARPEGARLERGVGRRRARPAAPARGSSAASRPVPSSTSPGGSRTSSTRASSSRSSPTAAGST